MELRNTSSVILGLDPKVTLSLGECTSSAPVTPN